MQKKKQNKPIKQIILFVLVLILFLLITFAEDIIKLINKNQINLAENSEREITTNEIISNEPNIPQLSAGMIPVKWDGKQWKITTQDDKYWYDYSKGIPAYVMLNDGKYQSELIRDMTGKELAENNIGVGIPDDPQIRGSIYMWIPRFEANNNTSDIKYIKGLQNAEEGYNIPKMFSYAHTEETMPDFLLTGSWVAKNTGTSEITEMNNEDGKYGFIANTKAIANNEITQNAIETYIKKMEEEATENTLINDIADRNRIILDIIQTKNQDPIKVKANYNKETNLITVEVTYSQFGIDRILYEDVQELKLEKSNNKITANTNGIDIEKGNRTVTIIDKAGNIKKITLNVVPAIWVAYYPNDGTLAFAKQKNPLPEKGTPTVNDISAEDGYVIENAYTAWYSQKNNIKTVEFIDKISTRATNIWFSNCKNLTTVKNLQNLDISSATDMGEMFSNCEKLETIDLSNLNTSNVTNMRYMFANCKALKEINLSGLDTSNVTDIQAMFANCSLLNEIDLSSFDTSNVIYMDSIFSACSSLEKIDISNFVINSETSCSSIFTSCTSLVEIKIGENWEKHINLPAPTGVEETCIGWYKAKEFVEENKVADPYCDYMPQGAITLYAGFVPNIYVELTGLGNNEYKLSFAHDKTLLTKVDYNITGMNYYKTNSSLPWSSKTNQIIAVEFLDEIIPISTSRWFASCTKLTTILNIENLNTSRTIDMVSMFDNCSALETIDVSHFDVSEARDMQRMFCNCSNLKTLDLNDWNTGRVTNMSSMFGSCCNLKLINLNNWNTSNVTNMFYMFGNCKSLTEVYANDWNTSNVSNMSDMFNSCEALTAVYAENWDTSNVTNMQGMFNCCLKLETLNLSNWKIDSANDISSMFANCSSLKTLDLSNWKATSKLQNIDNLFIGCIALETLNVKKLVMEDQTNISNMFNGLTSLTSIDMSEWNTSNVTNMSYMFYGCSSLTFIDMSEWNTSNVTNMSYMFYGCSSLTSLDVSSFDTSNVTNMTNIFNACDNLVEIKFGDKWNKSVKLPEPKKDGHVFYAWYSDKENINEVARYNATYGASYTPTGEVTIYAGFLEDIYVTLYRMENGEYKLSFASNSELLPIEAKYSDYGNIAGKIYSSNIVNNSNTPPWIKNSTIRSKITTVEFLDKITPIATSYWFSNCNNLTTILNLSNLDTSKSIDMKYMFFGCSKIETLDLSSLDTSKVTDMYNMFYNCSNLKTLDLSDWNTGRVTNMSNMFAGCFNLELINLNNWNTSNVTYMTCMFSADMDLKTLDLSSFDTSNVIEMSAMFSDCINLETVYIGPEWTTENAATGDMTRGCPAEFVLNLYSVMSSVMRAVQNVNAI